MIIVSKEEGAKWPTLGSKGELRGFYGTVFKVVLLFWCINTKLYKGNFVLLQNSPNTPQ